MNGPGFKTINRSRMIAPYKRVCYHYNAKELFNLQDMSLHNAVERAFGVLKKRFPIIASTMKPTYLEDTQTEIGCILYSYLMGVDPNESLIVEVDEEVLQSHLKRVSSTPRDIIRDSIALFYMFVFLSY